MFQLVIFQVVTLPKEKIIDSVFRGRGGGGGGIRPCFFTPFMLQVFQFGGSLTLSLGLSIKFSIISLIS